MGKGSLLMEGCFERWRKVDFSAGSSTQEGYSNACVLPGACCVCFCSYLSFPAADVYYENVLYQRPSRGGRTNLHCCLFFSGTCHPTVLTSMPAQRRPLLTPSLLFLLLWLCSLLLLCKRLIPRLLSSFNVIWTCRAFEEEENQRVDPSCGFRRIEHA